MEKDRGTDKIPLLLRNIEAALSIECLYVHSLEGLTTETLVG